MCASEPYGAGNDPAQKLFISYRRSPDDDRALASYLKKGLEQAGHEVFIDVDMTVGADWAAEIEQQIASCDHLVALLSEQSINSEMVQEEVRMAHQAKRDDGRPTILPVRVSYDGPLGYELSAYLSRLNYARWDGEDDNEPVLDSLLRATTANGLQEAQPAPFDSEKTAQDPRRPEPVSDPRVLLRRPGGTVRIDDPFYIVRPVDQQICDAAGVVGETILIKAPRQMGKSSLLFRYLDNCRETSKRIVYLDFQGFTNADLDIYEIFLQRITAQILRSLELEDPGIATIDSQQAFVYFIEDHVLKKLGEPITFAFDEVDRLLERPFKADFFSMLRTWHNNRANLLSPWADVDLALVIATEPYLLIDSNDQSPFNVAVPIEPKPFERPVLDELNCRYDTPLNGEQLDRHYKLLAGHPYLTRLAFFRIVGQDLTFEILEQHGDREDGPFGDHLRAKLMLLQKQPELLQVFMDLIEHEKQPDRDDFHRLQVAGLACRREGDKVKPANDLYARFFKQVQ